MAKEILLAKTMGFCFGVKRALEIVEDQNKPLNILGDLIHNKVVLNRLREQGVKIIQSLAEADSNTIVITAHGIADSVKNQIKEEGYNLVDTTCPFVEKIHVLTKQKEKEGYFIILIGKQDHVEVKGVVKDLKNKLVVENEEDVNKIKSNKLAIFCQTTQEIDKIKKIVSQIKTKVEDVVFYDTTCEATRTRQAAAKEVAEQADIMIVIGGKHSNNTQNLAKVCSEFIETHHIEFPEELQEGWLKDKNKIGITAGASTPPDIIDEIVKRIKEL